MSPITLCSDLKYFVLLVDDYSRYAWIFPMKIKIEVPMHFYNFRLQIENLCNARIRCLQSDGGGEYTSSTFTTYLIVYYITHRLSYPYTPSHNRLTERNLRHLTETTRIMLLHASVPPTYWVDVVLIATYIERRDNPHLCNGVGNQGIHPIR